MAAFVPLDEPSLGQCLSETVGGGGTGDSSNFLRTAEELRSLPADLISPLPAYSFYRQHEAAHHPLVPPTKARPNPFTANQQQEQQIPSHALLPPSSSSSSSWPLFHPSSYSPAFNSTSSLPTFPPYPSTTPVDLGLSTVPPRGTQSSSFSTPPFIYSPGLHLNLTSASSTCTSTGYDFSQQYFPLTPPVEDSSKAGVELSSYPFTSSSVSSSSLPPVFPSLLSPYTPVTNEHSFTVPQGFVNPSTSSNLSPKLLSLPHPPSAPSSSTLSSLISSGIARRRLRVPPLPSPCLSSSSNPSSSTARSQPPKAKTSQGGGRSQYSRDEVISSCSTCHVELATLQLRKKGGAQHVDFVNDFTCFECKPDLAALERTPGDSEELKVGYHSSLSALLDREEGTEIQRKRRRVGSRAKARRSASTRQTSKDNSLTCDVCRRTIASGDIRPSNPGEKLNFTVEVICSHCSSTYRRCSDDGGGGGRLGVGKWRCKELFEEGRKNCSFSHARMGPIQDLIYDTHSMSSISQDLARLETTCFEFYRNSVLSALAVPDVLEGEDPIAISYDQIEKMAVDSWTYFEPFFKPCYDTTKKRYIGLRWANPTTRKKGRKLGYSPSLSASDSGSPALRLGLRLTGFAIMEVDIENGILFTPLAMPIGSVGETYDASTTLLQHLSRHIASELEIINLDRRRKHLPSLPPIRDAWTAVLFSKDTRGANHLETRRGYLPLEKYASIHGEVSTERIESRLNEFLPSCLQGGWRLFARPYGGATDDWGQLASNRRRRKSVSLTDHAKSTKFENEEDSDDDYEEVPASRRSKRSRL
ncbi:hypothetical protein JCM5350_007826 [Sporobolomyces pararoseus]